MADEIRHLYRGGKTRQALMKQYGFNKATIDRIVSDDWPAWEIYRSHKSVVVDILNLTIPAKDVGMRHIHQALAIAPEIKEVIVADRTFETFKELFAGKFRSGVKVRCSKGTAPNCRKSETFFLSGQGQPHPVHAANQFRNKGWLIGGGPRADVCPECRNHKPEAAPKVAELVASNAMIDEKNSQPVSKTPVTMADIPIDDRRIINMELERIYDLTRKGYKDDWNDARLAKHLGCKVEFIAIIREFGFGPEGSTRDFDAAVDEVKNLVSEIREVEKTIKLGIERMEELDTKLNERISRFEKLQSQLHQKVEAFMRMVPK
jgi:hypothetical protein